MKDLLRKDLVKTFLAESKLGFNEKIGFGEYFGENILNGDLFFGEYYVTILW